MSGIWCNFKQRRVSWEECKECAKCLPSQVIERLRKDFVLEPNRYGITELVGCLRKAYFSRTREDYPTLKDCYILSRGLAFHSWFNEKFHVKELKLERRFPEEGFDIVGIVDALHQTKTLNTLIEFKSVSRIPAFPYPTHILQLQGYYTLCSPNIRVDKLILVYFSMLDYKWFEVEKKDISEFLFLRAKTLHECLKNNKLPPVEQEFCSWCRWKLDCKLEEMKGGE